MFTDSEVTEIRTAFILNAMSLLQEDGHLYPTAFIFCSVDPKTGAPGKVVVPVVGSFTCQEAKEEFAAAIQTVAIAGLATHAIMAMDAWFIRRDPRSDDGVRPSEAEDRRECLHVVEERLESYTLRSERVPYVRDQGEILFQEHEVDEDSLDAMTGLLKLLPRTRETGPLSEEIIQRARAACRAKMTAGEV